MTITKKAFIGILSLTAAVLLAACSGNTNQGGNTSSSQNTQGQTSQSAQNQTSQSSAASSSNQPSSSSNAGQATNLDGRYQATDHDGDQHVLEINGTTVTWTETDGSKEIKQVQVDAANQRLIVGDDAKSYRQNGNQLIVDELDDDPDTLTFTKQ